MVAMHSVVVLGALPGNAAENTGMGDWCLRSMGIESVEGNRPLATVPGMVPDTNKSALTAVVQRDRSRVSGGKHAS